MSEVMLSLKNVDKFYGSVDKGIHAVKDINMDIQKGEIIALLGSSGCGKTSTLRMIAGFETTSRGKILLAGREVQNLRPVQRNVAMAFEGYSLYPTVNVRENIAFALKSAGLQKSVVDEKVEEIAAMLEISDILDRFPSSISGGQQQRASLARALIRTADLYLLDEPMGQLEPQLRTLLRGRIKQYIKEHGLTAILVTHDQTEANALADKIAVMEGGVLQQFGSPDDIKDQPANLFTGTFVGEPPMNILRGATSVDGNKVRIILDGDVELNYPISAFSKTVLEKLDNLESAMIGIRPYAVKRVEKGVQAEVVANQWLGDQSHIAAKFANNTMILVEHDRANLVEGSPISIYLDPKDFHIFDVKSGKAICHGSEVV